MPKGVQTSPKFRKLFVACMAVIEAERKRRCTTMTDTAAVIGKPSLSIDQYGRYVSPDHPTTPDVDIFFEMCSAVALTPEHVISQARKMLENTEVTT